MQLPFFSRREPQKNFFLSILIKPHKVGAILFEEINGKLFILSTNEVSTDGQTGNLTDEELLHFVDRVVSFVEGSLPEGSNVEKTIFSVPHSWVEEGKIAKDYLLKLKQVCDGLGLVPMGYLVSIEAIVSFLQETEGAPVSAIFIEVAQDSVFLYLVRAGKILEVESHETEGSVLKTVEKLLKEIDSVDVLPSKIILSDYKGVEGIHQEFLSHQWPKDIPFLHIPQVVVLERGFENEATINGVASQMELEVLADVRAEIRQTSAQDSLEEAGAQDFGFVKEKDIAILQDSEEIKEQEAGQEGQETIEEPNIKYFKKKGQDLQEQESEPQERKLLPFVSSLSAVVKRLRVPDIGTFYSFAFLKGTSSLKTKLVIFGIAILIFIFLFSYLYYNFILRAQVIIFADKKAVDKTQDVTFETTPASPNSIQIEHLQKEISGDETKNSTGKKETGDKAKGDVTIYNKTDQKKNFSKGTVLVGPNDLEFELQDEVNVASTSSFSTTLSSAKAKVLAVKFGKEYNLPSNSNFTVKGLSATSFIGKNTDAITGGTKKETTVVSGDDLENLLTLVVEKLEKEAVSLVRKSAGSDEEIFPKALSYVVSEKKYTKKENEEAGSIGIKAVIEFSLGKYKKAEVQGVVESISRGAIPGTYALEEGESKVDIINIKIDQKNKSANAKLSVNAIYTPKIDNLKLAEALAGKSEAVARKQIEDISGVTEVVINFRNQLPLFPLTLPQNRRNISIEVKN